MAIKTYNYQKPSEVGLLAINRIRKAYSELDDLVRESTPTSREQAVALTNLEQSAMWAIKAVVCNDPESTIAEL